MRLAATAAVCLAMAGLLSACVHAGQAGPADAAPWRGRWQSDRERTLAFAREHVKLEPRTAAFLESAMGHLVMEFGERELAYGMPDIRVKVPGGEAPFAGMDVTVPYRVLHSSAYELVILAPNPVTGDPQSTTYHFDGPDVMWAYTGSSHPGMPENHLREYFRRLPQEPDRGR